MKAIAASLLLLAAAHSAGAVPAGVVYTEGEAVLRLKAGTQREALIGDTLNTGDGVRTGADGFVELDQKGVTLRIEPGTVFTLMEKEQKGRSTGVLALALGSVKFRYDRLTGQEPLIQTSSCIAGVRGTELTVYAGADGSALIVVEKGAVEVEAEGAVVALAPEEAVEVRPGQPPGDKFTVRRDQVDYRTWNDEKLQALAEDPLASLQAVRERLEYYIDNMQEYEQLYRENKQLMNEARQKQAEMAKTLSQEEVRKHDTEVTTPLVALTFNQSLNIRYFALAALSLRRFVAGRMYLLQKASHLEKGGGDFSSLYEELLQSFERQVVPYLSELDI
jgi:hypothetical protein